MIISHSLKPADNGNIKEEENNVCQTCPYSLCPAHNQILDLTVKGGNIGTEFLNSHADSMGIFELTFKTPPVLGFKEL